MPEFLTDPNWLAVILALLFSPVVGWGARALWKRYKQARAPFKPPKTQTQEDRNNYILLLKTYESNLELLNDLIILRARVERGPEEWNSLLEQEFVRTRDHIYHNLERHSDREEDMGIFQKLDILEGRNTGWSEERKKRAELEARQIEIENHSLFVQRP